MWRRMLENEVGEANCGQILVGLNHLTEEFSKYQGAFEAFLTAVFLDQTLWLRNCFHYNIFCSTLQVPQLKLLN